MTGTEHRRQILRTPCERFTGGMDAEDPEPALEINHELTAKLPEELLKRDLKQGKLGPPIIKHNVVSAVVLDASARRCERHQDSDDTCSGMQLRNMSNNAHIPKAAQHQC